ncbi:hypothetical protein HPB51_004763 [Rhipicephalus microplus]|uniref:Uncharacterized protein n=1 Tax=Rhipicephalus microplus TaxID=6941 RepID=A0A9J6DTE7_RHIMP|nr:hypothetical protein HPB51_004763 [Rhipicephalus microplus]
MDSLAEIAIRSSLYREDDLSLHQQQQLQPLPTSLHSSSLQQSSLSLASQPYRHQTQRQAPIAIESGHHHRGGGHSLQLPHLAQTVHQQLSPVKKRVKESSPPKWEVAANPVLPSAAAPVSAGRHHDTHGSRPVIQSGSSGKIGSKERQRSTIVIRDTPSPAISVITISSDSEDDRESPACSSCKGGRGCRQCASQQQASSASLRPLQPAATAVPLVSSTCASVVPLTPEEERGSYQSTPRQSCGSRARTQVDSSSWSQPLGPWAAPLISELSSEATPLASVFQRHGSSTVMLPSSSSSGGGQVVTSSGVHSSSLRPRMASCITVPDSDSEGHYSPARALPNFTTSVLTAKAIKPEPQRDPLPISSSSSSLCSQKKRLLCHPVGGNVVVTPKREVDDDCSMQLRPAAVNGYLEGERLVKCSALMPPVSAAATLGRPHLSPLQHIGQPLHLAPSSQPELYRCVCHELLVGVLVAFTLKRY